MIYDEHWQYKDDGFFKILKSAIDKGLIKNMVKPIKLISHRGNLNGPNPDYENKCSYIEDAIQGGYQVEVDLWVNEPKDDSGYQIYLSHDQPTFKDRTSIEWLLKYQFELLIHCKNKEAVEYAMKFLDGEWFSHDQDRWAGTSESHLICYGQESDIIDDDLVILMMPEHHNIKNFPKNIYAICTDLVRDYETLLA